MNTLLGRVKPKLEKIISEEGFEFESWQEICRLLPLAGYHCAVLTDGGEEKS